MKLCPHCEEPNATDSIYCSKCGGELSATILQPQATEEPKGARKAASLTYIVGSVAITGIILWTVVSLVPFKPSVNAPAAPATKEISSAASAPPARNYSYSDPSPTDRWMVNESTSQMDDSPFVALSLKAENEIKGWLESSIPTLVIRCLEGKIEMYIDTLTGDSSPCMRR